MDTKLPNMLLSYLQESKRNTRFFLESITRQSNDKFEVYNIEEIKNTIICGDCLEELKKFPSECIDTIMTSPPYWGLRDYGVEGQLGLEKTLDEYLEKLLQITAELKRVLKPTGVMFWNHGDNYSSKTVTNRLFIQEGGRRSNNPLVGKFNLKVPEKCLALQNYRLILKMIDEQGWILRNTIIWHKPNHMPRSVRDRFSNAYESVFMLVKKKKYWFDLDAVRIPAKYDSSGVREYREGNIDNSYKPKEVRKILEEYKGKNPGDVWQIPTQPSPFSESHHATYPEKLCEKPILSSCPQWVCKKCGKARERIVETITVKKKERGSNPSDSRAFGPPQQSGIVSLHETKGWTNCGCNAGWKAGIVLDPFAGSCTTAVVAKKHKRNWIMIEINPKYCEMGRQRLNAIPEPLPLFE